MPITKDEYRPVDFPLGGYLALRIGFAEDGSAAGEMEMGPHHLNPHGFVHGGVIFTMLDTVMGAAAMSLVGPNERVATVDLHIRFHQSVRSGILRASVRTLHRSSSTITLLGEVTLINGDRVASATGSFRVLSKASQSSTPR